MHEIQKIGAILFLMIGILFSVGMVYAETVEVPEDIRVGLYYGSSAVASFRLMAPGGMEIGIWCDGEFEKIYEVEASQTITVTKGEAEGSVLVSDFGEIGSEEEYPYFHSLEKNGLAILEINGKRYRGNIEVRRFSKSDMTVINHLSMQEYLYGVVPREIGGNSPLEAVKAQAIVARTYATKNYGRRASLGFDVYPTVDDQAYGGYEWENKNSNLAVDETDGQVVVYQGELIGGYYFSTSGGYTESSENVWGGKYDYLQAVPDPYEPEVAGNTTWEVEYTAKEIKEMLEAKGIDVGDIISLEPIEYTEAGRVLTLKVVGIEGEKLITKSKTREYLGLKSQWYTINDEAPEVKEFDDEDLPGSHTSSEEEDDWWMKEDSKTGEDLEDGECIVIQPDYSSDEGKLAPKEDSRQEDTEKERKPLLTAILQAFTKDKETLEEKWIKKDSEEVKEVNTEYQSVSSQTTFVFRGRGWGHAIGMSQNGAKGMAEEGFSCEEIIQWYYSGVDIIG